MKKIILFFSMALFIALNGYALNEKNDKGEKSDVENVQVTYVLKGIVIDHKTDEAVAGATVIVDGAKYYSDFSGNFSIPTLTKGKHTLSVDFISYQPKVMEIDLTGNQEINIEISQR